MSTKKALPSAALGASQEAQEEAFAEDPRIHFSTVTKRWTFEDDDGNEFEYEASKGVWVPVVRFVVFYPSISILTLANQIDEELLKKQQAAYSVAGVDEEARLALANQPFR